MYTEFTTIYKQIKIVHHNDDSPTELLIPLRHICGMYGQSGQNRCS